MKQKRIKSALPIYGAAAVWLLMGMICPRMLLKLWFIFLTALISCGVYLGLSRLFPGRAVEVREAANSGDDAIDALIEDGRARLDRLSAAGASASNEAIAQNLARMCAAGEEIFKLLERDVSKASAVRRFMNYYLPTADKLVETYRMLRDTRSAGENIISAMRSVENSLNMIAAAFEKQLDNLYKDKSLDVETDIDVLETMLANDGLINVRGMGNGAQQAEETEHAN